MTWKVPLWVVSTFHVRQSKMPVFRKDPSRGMLWGPSLGRLFF
jgi:hypothetical protein